MSARLVWGLAAALFVGSPVVERGGFVYRVCFTKDDPDVSLRVVKEREKADMCGYETDCAHADVRVQVDAQAARSVWMTSNPERCR